MSLLWDEKKYTEDFGFVREYGKDLFPLIEKSRRNGMRLLDLGCGNGELTNELTEDGFAAEGMDASEEFLAAARKRYPGIRFFKGDAVDFHAEQKYDAVFSNAMLHWVGKEKQPDLLGCVCAALNEGGQFVFEMGGNGNNDLIHAALAKAFLEKGMSYRMPLFFPTIGEYAGLLEAAGFTVKYAVLFDRPTALKGNNGMRDWLSMFVKVPFDDVEEAVKMEIIDKVVSSVRPVLYRDGTWYSDYVRLRIRAVKEK